VKSFLAFIRKEFHHIFRDKRTLVVLFGMPIAQLFLFGYAITTEIKNASIAILDHAHNTKSIELVNDIISSGYFSIEEEVQTYQEIDDAFRRGKIKAAIVIPSSIGSGQMPSERIQILADGTDPNFAAIIVAYLSSIASRISMPLSPQTALIDVEHRMWYNLNQRSVNMFVPGVITFIMLLVSAMLTSISITREKEMGNMEVLLVSPLKPIIIVLGKVIPYLMLSMVNVTSVLTFALLVFDVPMQGSFVLLALATLTFVVCALSLGVLISSIAKTQQVALMMSLMGLMLPTILLSNFIFPVTSMPLLLQWISIIIPAKYFVSTIRGIMLKGAGIDVVLSDMLILTGMTVVFIIISVKKFKIRL
jgi:ABC-2 type transport system permease protein